jgi:hypothetical protein
MPDNQERRPARVAMGADSTIGPSDLGPNAASQGKEIKPSARRWRLVRPDATQPPKELS